MIGQDGLVFLVIVGLKFTKILCYKEGTQCNWWTCEVLDDIKTWFFELDELTADFTPEQKDQYLMLWVQNLKKMTGQIRKTAAKDALKQLQEEGLVLTREVIEEVQNWN